MALFSKDNIIVYFNRNNLIVYNHDDKSTQQINLQEQKLTQAFKTIGENYQARQAKLILANELSYTLSLHWQQKNTPNREKAIELVAGFVPEEITDKNFDWQLKQTAENNTYIQAFVINAQVLAQLQQATKQAGLEISSIKPVTSLLVDQLSNPQETQLLLWVRWEPQLLVHDHGCVIHSQNLIGYNAQEINTIRAYIQREYNHLKITSAIIDWPENSNQEVINSIQDLNPQHKQLNPFTYYATLKENLNNDAETLCISLQS